MNLQQVHLRVNDAATGQPTPVRMRITDAEGNYHAPYGRLTEFATGVNQDVGGNVVIGARKWAYIDGTCEIRLPPGPLHIEIAKGPEYRPIDEHITLLAGKMSRRFTVERWSDARKDGWHSGDTRAHYLTPDGALLEGQAEDLAVVHLLARETAITDQFGQSQPAIPNILSFSGQAFVRHSPGCGVAVNTHNVHPHLGSLGLLHCHRVVYPLRFADHGWTLDDWCGQCHRKNGLVVWTDPQHQTPEYIYGEPLANLINGDIDAFELTFFEDSPFDALADYYKLLNAGLTPSLAGASGKDNNGVVLGSMRTYAFIPSDKEFSLGGWIDAVRAGRTYVSNGPLLKFTIDGDVPSTKCVVPEEGKRLHVRVEARSFVPFDRLELLWRGDVIASVSGRSTAPCEATLEFPFEVKESGWLAARCKGAALVASRPAPQRVFAHTSAVAIRRGDRPAWFDAVSRQSLLGELDNLLGWANRQQARNLARIVQDARTRLSSQPS